MSDRYASRIPVRAPLTGLAIAFNWRRDLLAMMVSRNLDGRALGMVRLAIPSGMTSLIPNMIESCTF